MTYVRLAMVLTTGQSVTAGNDDAMVAVGADIVLAIVLVVYGGLCYRLIPFRTLTNPVSR